MLYLRKARIDATTETLLMSVPDGQRELSALMPSIRKLAARPSDGRSAGQYATVDDDPYDGAYSDYSDE